MDRSRKRILCIEDDEDTCVLLALWLGLSNCEVISAPTMARGIDLARHQGFDLYLVDSRLPDGTGVEVCHQIRAFDAHTPILFWSGDDDAPNQAYAAGAQAFIAKPIDPDPFKKTIEDLLRVHRSKEAERSV
ncbi:MAG: response regulator [Acidobacteria bacterium]|nr:response regulator [Acidobacteriota bacterium]MCI0721965.1 response regulator [Acidobacteriota bacterium]